MNKFREIRRKATLSIKRNNAQKDLSEIGKRAIETKEKRNAVQNTLDNKGYLSTFLLKNSLNNGRKEVNNTVKSFKTFYDSNPKRLFTSAKRVLTSERRANASRSLTKKRNATQRELSEIGKKTNETQKKRNNTQSTLARHGRMSKIFFPKNINKEKRKTLNRERNFIQKYVRNGEKETGHLKSYQNRRERNWSAFKANKTQEKRNYAQSKLNLYGLFSKMYLPTNKENHASTKRNHIQKYVKSYENTSKRFNELKGNYTKRNVDQIILSSKAERQKILDELKGLKHQPKSKSSATRPMPRPRIRNPSRSSASNEPKTMSASRSMPRPRSRSRALSNASQSKEAPPKSLKTMSAPRPRVSSRSRSSASKDKNDTEVKAEPEIVLQKSRQVNPALLKECEDSYKKLMLEMNEMEFSHHHNKREYEQSNNIFYSLLQDRNFDYVSLDHKFKDEEQTIYGDYKKNYEELDKKYKLVVTFYKELKGKCISKDTEEDCYMMHKILRSEFNIFQIARDYYYEQKDHVNRLVHSIMDRDIDEVTLDVTVKRHFKDDEQATYAYYRKSYDEVNKTYKKVMQAYNELVTDCEIHPHLKQMINLQMSELSKNGF
jgi:hypothetical protein